MNTKNYKIEKIIVLQKLFRTQLDNRNKIQNEIDSLLNLSNKIIIRINTSYLQNIINENEYKHFMESVSECLEKLNIFPSKITIKKISEMSKYKIMICIAEVKLKLINIVQKSGSENNNDILKLMLNLDYNNIQDKKYLNLANFYNNVFNPIGCDIYESTSKENSSFKLYNYGDKETTGNNIKLTSFQLEYPTCNKISIFTKSLIQKLYGAKLYFPLKSKLLVIYGYFIKDDLNIFRQEEFLCDKETSLKKEFKNLDISESFKENFLAQISLKDFILMSKDDICNSCISAFNDLKKLKNKNISSLVKEFLINDIEKQRYYITILVLDSDDNDSHYLAYLLYDLISSDSNVLNSNSNYLTLYSSLHWSVQKLFRNSKKNIEKINNSLNNFNEESIPYEKRIHLMKASDYVKAKALDKLKEINSSKGGETNAKAQQYIDGLLKVPFGQYKIDSLSIKIQDSYNKIKKNNSSILSYINDLEENYSISDDGLNILDSIKEEIKELEISSKNPISLHKYYTNITDIIENSKSNNSSKVELSSLNNFKETLLSQKNSELKKKCELLGLSKSGNKNNLVEKIIECEIDINKFNEIFTEYINLPIENININNLDLFNNELKDKIKNIEDIWKDYKIDQKKYLDQADKYLDKAVYGLKEAKDQIKRIIGQWINGENKGYVFGFEGPPGTGKTTLAKKGISKCLQDSNGKNRPFIFIALGGSSNGSTLEGHNYTYVGSTWGRIVDALMEAKCMNPIIYIDELDKISRTEHGKEIVGILTHLTDPAQNEEFADKYFSGIKFDISKCLIIFSYNDANLIDRVLLDRIQRIRITPLNKVDKLTVARKHILPEIFKNVGIFENSIILSDDILIYLIDTYTYEAGARKLKEKLYEIVREINLEYLKDNYTLPFTVTQKFVDKLFENCPKTTIQKINDEARVGLVNGLFATSAGIGGITIVEAFKSFSNNHLELELTGQQGDVMKESMKVAKTVAWNLLPKELKAKLRDKDANKFGIHIHCPAAATPKDGPSAGTAITLCILSLLTGKKISNKFGITGEIDLNGNCLQIGGLESKIDGAKAAGITHVLCPKQNENDLEKIRLRSNPPEDDNFKVTMIENVYEAISHMIIFEDENENCENYFEKLHLKTN